MNLILLSDTHLLWDKPISRLDDLHQTQFIKLKFIFDFAKETNSKIIIAGDVFNKPRSWNLLPEMTDFLKKYDIEIFAIFGQHDTYMYSTETRDKTNLGVLAKAGLVKILGEKPFPILDNLEWKDLYGVSYGQEIPKIEKENHFNVLVIHAPIAAKALYPNQQFMDALTFLKENPFDLIIAGDIHQKYMFEYEGRYICNSGTLLRKEATEYNFTHKPGFWTFDTDKKEPPKFIEVPHQKAEEILSRTHLDYEKESESVLNEFISSISETKIEEGVSFTENLWRFVKENNIEKPVVDLLSEVINKGE
jgi:DNA repair exonuclease SbcCD nuclease subunit